VPLVDGRPRPVSFAGRGRTRLRTGKRVGRGALSPADPVEVDPVREASEPGRELLVGDPEAFVELALAVPVRRTQAPRVHDQHPSATVDREALHDDHVAARGPSGPEGSQHRPARADLGRERQPPERPRAAGLVVLPPRQVVARRLVVEAKEVRPLHERRPDRHVAPARDASRGHAGARRDATSRHAEHLFGLPALTGQARPCSEELHHHLAARRPAPVAALLRRVAEAQGAFLARLSARRRRAAEGHGEGREDPAEAKHVIPPSRWPSAAASCG
jgi:hypothetical protein